ncbi:hypothetical protein [Runella sp.]|uniref:hypothetical protein n=1 Tax=Runella sp. TaxID=1960881 RepID=UPI003D09870B
MPQLEESGLLRKIKLRRFIRDYAEDNQKRFADLVGLSQNQISHMVGVRDISDKMWNRIINALNVKDTATNEDYEKLKEQIELSKSTAHQGQQLEQYLRKHGIKNKDAAERLGVSPAMMVLYKNSAQFRPEVADKIRKFIQTENDPILTETRHVYAKLPIITDTERNLTDLSNCPTYEINRKMEYDLEGAVIVKIETDTLEPAIKNGSTLLALKVEERKYKYHTGITVINYADMVAVGDVTSNDILDKGYITLHRGKGAVLRVLAEDIQNLWHIVLGLNVKF